MKRLKQNTVAWKIFSVLVGSALVGLAVLLVLSNIRMLSKTLESMKYRNIAEANLKELSARQSELTERISELETDSGVDKEIRERFPVAKPGEEVIMIVNNKANAAAADSVPQKPFWDKLKSWWQSL